MQTIDTDITILGAGPAGLCLARALSGAGLRITVLDREPDAALRAPAFDGREIALTQRSVRLLQGLDVWRRLPGDERHPLREARVFNGTRPDALQIGQRARDAEPLGWLVPNHAIRAAAFESVADARDVELHASVRVAAVDTDATDARVRLDDGRLFVSRLLVAADGRFSETRRALGIATRMHDFGRSMLVCRVTHERPHADTAWEWFDHGQTLARLPLGRAAPDGCRASIVLTLPAAQMRAVQSLDDAAFAQDIARRFDGRLGAVSDVGERRVYPLVGAWATRFVATRAALLGDAAVGMHPVTAHGFNLGLLGVERLADELRRAAATGADPGLDTLLSRYDRAHRRATAPLHLATRGIVGLFTDDRPPARLLRAGLLRASALPPFRRLLAGVLADRGASGRRVAGRRDRAERSDSRPPAADQW